MQERRAFIERCLVDVDRFDFINLVEHPRLRFTEIESAHAVLIGGAGGYSVTDEHPFSPWLRDVFNQLVEEDRPVFGSCWGHQFMAVATGGEVIIDKQRSEVGTFEVELTDAGLRDPLFHGFPNRFDVQLGHNDQISRLSDDWSVLAFSELCPNQAIRLQGKPVYGTQFHSELNETRLRERLEVYLQEYVPDAEAYDRLMKRLRPSPRADVMLDRFLTLYAERS